LEQGIVFYEPHQPIYWHGHGINCFSFAAWVLWMLGYPDQALTRSHEALILAQELSHPSGQAAALYYTAQLHQHRREGKATQERAEAAIGLSTDRGIPTWLANSTVLQGWALAARGQGEAGVAQMSQGLTARRATGGEVERSYFLALLAEAYWQLGQTEEGLNALAEALAVAGKTRERFYEAELYRLKGELTLQSRVQGPRSSITQHPTPSTQAEAEAEACFLKAIEIARQQQAKSWELRAATSLARLWQSQGKTREAHSLLSEIYNWFTEGFDTKDLQEAKALIEELSR
jgi:predicted ATPase